MYIRSASSPSTVLWAFHTIQPSSFGVFFLMCKIRKCDAFYYKGNAWIIIFCRSVSGCREQVVPSAAETAASRAVFYQCIPVRTDAARVRSVTMSVTRTGHQDHWNVSRCTSVIHCGRLAAVVTLVQERASGPQVDIPTTTTTILAPCKPHPVYDNGEFYGQLILRASTRGRLWDNCPISADERN